MVTEGMEQAPSWKINMMIAQRVKKFPSFTNLKVHYVYKTPEV